MSGWIRARRLAAGVMDPISARSLVLEDEQGKRAAIVALDLLGTPVDLADELRRTVASIVGTEPEAVMVASTHTHAAPAVLHLRGCGTPQPEYVGQLREAVAESAATAARRMGSCVARWGRTKAYLSVNRREIGVKNFPAATLGWEHMEAGTTDPLLDVLLVQEPPGTPVAVLFVYAAHPVTLRSDNRLVSADFPGVARGFLERQLGHGAVALYLNGPAGDVNPRVFGTANEMQLMGEALGRAASDVVNMLRDRPPQERVDTIGWAETRVSLPLSWTITAAGLEAEQARWRAQRAEPGATEDQKHMADTMLEWCEDYLRGIQGGPAPEGVEVPVQALLIGNRVLVAMPAEVFAETGLRVREVAPEVIPVGYANGCVGYLPTRQAFHAGGYEAAMAYRFFNVASFGETVTDVLVDAAHGLITKVLNGQ